MSGKTAIVLFNLGGPDGRDSVRPFLTNFFSDPAIIGLPSPLRQILAWWIAATRSRKEAGAAYSLLSWKSPLLKNTQAQAAALENALNAEGQGGYKCFVSMRYWHPMADEVAQAVKIYDPERIVLLPLYPQYSTTTTGSSFQDWSRAACKAGLAKPTSSIRCYPVNDGFIKTSADKIKSAYNIAFAECARRNLKPPRLLFSAHGLPEKIIRAGDPYQEQCEQTAEAIVRALAIPNLDWQICYQSRVGRLKWIGPSTTEALEKAAADQTPVLIYPHAFVSEHVETLVEIEIEYRHLAEKLGIRYFARVGTVMDDKIFIAGLKDMILMAEKTPASIDMKG